MNTPVYVDTNVLMDFFLNRDSSAYAFFTKALRCAYKIIISDVVLQELHFQGLDAEAKSFALLCENVEKLEVLHATPAEKEEARQLLHITHYQDALHKVLAKRRNVAVLVTKNTRDFRFSDITVKRPEEM